MVTAAVVCGTYTMQTPSLTRDFSTARCTSLVTLTICVRRVVLTFSVSMDIDFHCTAVFARPRQLTSRQLHDTVLAKILVPTHFLQLHQPVGPPARQKRQQTQLARLQRLLRKQQMPQKILVARKQS